MDCLLFASASCFSVPFIIAHFARVLKRKLLYSLWQSREALGVKAYNKGPQRMLRPFSMLKTKTAPPAAVHSRIAPLPCFIRTSHDPPAFARPYLTAGDKTDIPAFFGHAFEIPTQAQASNADSP
jgi:hypothetical protein